MGLCITPQTEIYVHTAVMRLIGVKRMTEPWNLGDGFENVCNSVMRKLRYAGHQLEERERTIVNLDSYEVTAMIWALDRYMHDGWFAEFCEKEGVMKMNDYDYCEECRGLGDNYDEDNNYLCPDCPMNPDRSDEE